MLKLPAGPTLYDMGDIARVSGLSAGRVRNMRAQGALPEPVGELGGSPVWLEGVIVAWQEGRPKRRRRKALDTAPGPAECEPECETVGAEAAPVAQTIAPAFLPRSPEPVTSPEPDPPAPRFRDPVAPGESVGHDVSVLETGRRFVAECSCGWRSDKVASRPGAERRGVTHRRSLEH